MEERNAYSREGVRNTRGCVPNDARALAGRRVAARVRRVVLVGAAAAVEGLGAGDLEDVGRGHDAAPDIGGARNADGQGRALGGGNAVRS